MLETSESKEVNVKILCTIGPSSLNKSTIQQMARHGVDMFRINLSHTDLCDVSSVIDNLQSWSDIPICLDSEGAQVRNASMASERILYDGGDMIKIHRDPVIGDSKNISFTPLDIFHQIKVGDIIRVDFNAVTFKVVKIFDDYATATVVHSGYVGSNKAANFDREVDLQPVTPKDKAAFDIGLKKGISNYALSFTNCVDDVIKIRDIIGDDVNLISKIESKKGVKNLDEIIPVVDQILIDRGDLSREVPIEKIPFVQRCIIAHAQVLDTPVYVATNLLESMIHASVPTRAEANDVASTLIMGGSGLVLAAETAIGAHPVSAVKMIRSIIDQYNHWSPDHSCIEVLS